MTVTDIVVISCGLVLGAIIVVIVAKEESRKESEEWYRMLDRRREDFNDMICVLESALSEGKQMTDFKITQEPFSWNDNLSKLAIEDFDSIQGNLPYCVAQSIGTALEKLKLLEEQGVKVVNQHE